MNEPRLTVELEDALAQGRGFVRGPSYVLMSLDVYRETMGVRSDEDLADSLAAVREALADLEAGRGIPLDEAQRRLDEKYGASH